VVGVLVPLSLLAGMGNGLVDVRAAPLVTTRTAERMRRRVAAALGAVLNAASVASLATGGALAAVLDPRQVCLRADGLGAVVTVVLVARCAAWLSCRAEYFVREITSNRRPTSVNLYRLDDTIVSNTYSIQ
jgi:MFS family permease